MKYVKKPIPVEAVQIPLVHREMPDWFADAVQKGIIYGNGRRKGLCIKTLEGNMYAPWGYYIIRGVKGELYPCRADIFEETYEEYKGE